MVQEVNIPNIQVPIAVVVVVFLSMPGTCDFLKF